jgi:hypothetical protein
MSSDIFTKAISQLLDTRAGNKTEGYMVVNVRPGEKVSAMLDVLAHLYKRSPSEFVDNALSIKLADFAASSSDHISPILDVTEACMADKVAINQGSALAILEERGILQISNPFITKLDL